MTNFSKAQIESLRAKIKNIAVKRGAKFEEIFTVFLIERAVQRLMKDEILARSMIFKGGFVSVTIYSSPRYTIDLDAVMHGCSLEDAETHAKKILETDFLDGIWFQFEKSVPLKTQNETGGLRLQFRVGFSPIPIDIKRSKILHIDLGMGDPITPKPLVLFSQSLLKSEEINWQVYPVETICAEKIHPFVALGNQNSRAKDLFDLMHLLPQTNAQILKDALAKTFEYRKTELPVDLSVHFENLERTLLKRGWIAAVGDIKPLPKIEDCFEKVIEHFRKEQL